MTEQQPPVTDIDPIASLEQELSEYKDKYLRLLADMENTRKRLQKEKNEAIRFAEENVMAEILQPIDNFEKALGFAANMSDEVKNWAAGFQMILSQFKDVLHQHGVSPFSSVGSLFDPHKHEAVEMEETEAHPPGTVLAEFVTGYKSGERTIRAARVKVAKETYHNKEKEQTL
jgi:molecular chaperone GrpE